jgi:hypothetical protein
MGGNANGLFVAPVLGAIESPPGNALRVFIFERAAKAKTRRPLACAYQALPALD